MPNEIGVVAEDGIVTLTGTVDSHLEKWAAEEEAEPATWTAPGVAAGDARITISV